MKRAFALVAFLAAIGSDGVAGAEPDAQPYPGTIALAVDLTDAARKIFRVTETVPVRAGALALRYPKWVPGEHSPSGPITGVSGLVIRAGNDRLAWRRDRVDMYTIHLDVPAGVDAIELSFQFLSPTEGGEFGQSVSATSKLVDLEWNQVVFYPAGPPANAISIAPSARLPADWGYGTALAVAGGSGGEVRFAPVSLETLVDSPLLAGRHFQRVDLAPGARTPVHLDIAADHPQDLVIRPAQLAAHRNLVTQA